MNYGLMMSPWSSGGRFGAQRDVVSTLAGPAWAYAENGRKFASGLMDGKFDPYDAKNLKKLIPYNNALPFVVPKAIYDNSINPDDQEKP